MYRQDEIKDDEHKELRANLEKAIAALLNYEEQKEFKKDPSGVKAAEVQIVTKSVVVAEVLAKDEEVTLLMFTSTGDVPTWTAAGMAQMLISYSNAGWED